MKNYFRKYNDYMILVGYLDLDYKIYLLIFDIY